MAKRDEGDSREGEGDGEVVEGVGEVVSFDAIVVEEEEEDGEDEGVLVVVSVVGNVGDDVEWKGVGLEGGEDRPCFANSFISE